MIKDLKIYFGAYVVMNYFANIKMFRHFNIS